MIIFWEWKIDRSVLTVSKDNVFIRSRIKVMMGRNGVRIPKSIIKEINLVQNTAPILCTDGVMDDAPTCNSAGVSFCL